MIIVFFCSSMFFINIFSLCAQNEGYFIIVLVERTYTHIYVYNLSYLTSILHVKEKKYIDQCECMIFINIFFVCRSNLYKEKKTQSCHFVFFTRIACISN